MATSSGTTKTKPDNPNLTRSRSLGRKPKPAPSSEADGSDKKTAEKPVPNYLKPTISSRPDPVKFLKKNSAVEDKLLRRRSFDRPPSSLTSSTSSTHNKSLNTSPARSRDRPVVPREKPATGLRSSSFHGSSSRGGRGGSTVKSAPVASRGSPGVKKSGLSGGSSSKSKKEGSENVPKKPLGKKEITPESSSPPAPEHKDEEEIVKVKTDVQVSEPKEEDKDEVVQPEEPGEEETGQVDVSKEEGKDEDVQPEESGEEKETGLVDASKEEEKGELIIENATEEQTEEQKEPENTEENNNKDKEEVEDYEENSETVVTPVMKEAENVEESKEEEDAEAKEAESESNKVEEAPTETKDQAEESPEEGAKKEVVQGKKESPSAYNDVIASKMQENKRKNKVLALAGAFQTVIDYETAASK
ncbi:PREDICTED: arginine and glutamate-rich protein 1-like [Brassica oleracea var. oleracea]|nr:PREDICTED: arginine and glutamate-rich protein 1-like [Brassica oleracea var. oleracea]XP_013630797.1 PREDICTED: arginine and glutamate-rich protein 1-like [Brassica oleracea var. oleracea]